MRKPVNQPYVITTGYGELDSYSKFGKHTGLDFAVPLNRTVYSPVDGTIVYAKKHATGGNMLMIKDRKGNYHRLMHNNSFIRTSGTVKQGEPVARAGTTGLSTGVHVHWDICRVMWPDSFLQFFNPNTYNDKQEITPMTKAQHDAGTQTYRTVLHKEPPTYNKAVDMGKRYKGMSIKNLGIVEDAMAGLRKTATWIKQHKIIKGAK